MNIEEGSYVVRIYPDTTLDDEGGVVTRIIEYKAKEDEAWVRWENGRSWRHKVSELQVIGRPTISAA